MTAESCLSVLMIVFSSLLVAFPTNKTQNTIKYTVADTQKTSVLWQLQPRYTNTQHSNDTYFLRFRSVLTFWPLR